MGLNDFINLQDIPFTFIFAECLQQKSSEYPYITTGIQELK
jgi:hypothetical protein